MARTPIALAERYRRTAQTLRALAEAMAEGDGRDALLRAADGYDEMAKRAAATPDADPESGR